MKKVQAKSEHEHMRSPQRGRQRLFDTGDLKLLVLHLIQQSPKHGYEIIKDIGQLVGGEYRPSAGTIYPTLNYLQEMHWIQSGRSTGGRKQYLITEPGMNHLQQQVTQLDSILGKLKVRRDIHSKAELIDIYRAMENLKTALRLRLQQAEPSEALVSAIAAQIDQAATAITRCTSSADEKVESTRASL